MACSSIVSSKCPNMCPLDRLSTLPEDVLHRVCIHLDFLDVVRTCVLSRRWRYIWTTIPYLNFSMDWFLKHNYDKKVEVVDPHCKFWDFIKWSLLLRDGGSQIIRIFLDIEVTMVDQLNGLLRFASKQKVKELCLVDGDYTSSELEFPRSLCESLTMLTLKSRDSIPFRVSTVFNSLKSLSLTSVTISRDVAERLLSNGCIKLEDVLLEDCQVKDLDEIHVSATNLKILTILNISTYEKLWFLGCFDSLIRICAPNLLSFSYVGPMPRGFVFMNTVSLERASIRLLRVPPAYQAEYKNHMLYSGSFSGLSYAKTLTLSSLVVKYFCPHYGEFSLDKFILDNLSHLELEARYTANHIEGLVHLMKFAPNIESLFIKFKKGQQVPRFQSRRRASEIGRSWSWKSRVEDIACLSYHVKTIQISNVNSEGIALELVKFLLQNGKALKKMEVLHVSGEVNRKKFSKLLSAPKASSDVVISFSELYGREFPWFNIADSDPEYND